MARRTNEGAVRQLLGANYDGCTGLLQFIDSATPLIDRVVTCATAKDKTLTAAEEEMLERWVAAHCYQMYDQGFSSKTQGRSSGTFQGQTAMGLDGTKYGQYAKTLDPSGCLAALDKGQRIQFAWLGKPPSEQTDYVDRD